MGIKDLFGNSKCKGKGKKEKNERIIVVDTFADSLMHISSVIMDTKNFNPVTMHFIRMSMEFELLISKNELDESIFIQNRLEEYLRFVQGFGEYIVGEDNIMFYERIPKLLEELRLTLKEKEMLYEGMKSSAEHLFEVFDEIERSVQETDDNKEK